MARREAVNELGTLYGVGVGPGDTELLTLKAARLLAEVRNIAYPAANGGESLARHIVAPLIPETARELPISIPMTQNREAARHAYDRAAEQISSHLTQGEDVLFLCEGDPFFYGSFMFIHERLNGRFPCVIVPGVTSLTACAAAVGRPLAARNDVLKIIPATLPEERIRAELSQVDAAAIIKIGPHFPKVRALLEELGLTHSSAIVERATQGDQRIFRFDDLPEGERPYFSTILVYNGGEPWR
jgi:precorrin-2/cobalt-factor-2 C20-methyltransferase